VSLPAPILYSVELLTWWHVAIWAAVVLMIGLQGSQSELSLLAKLGFAAAAVALFYLLFMPIIGQVFGDKFSLSQVWPTSALIGIGVAATFYLYIFAINDKDAPTDFFIFGFLIHSVFLGLVLNLFLFLVPRVVSYGPAEIPAMSWGVINQTQGLP